MLQVDRDAHPRMNWRSLFASKEDQSLHFFPSQIDEGVLTIKPPNDVFDVGIRVWKHSLVPLFIGNSPNFGSLQHLTKKIWRRCGEIAIHPASENLFLFQFASEEDCTWVLENGPWHIQNKPIVLRTWTPNLKSLDFGMDSLPIWVHLMVFRLSFSRAWDSVISLVPLDLHCTWMLILQVWVPKQLVDEGIDRGKGVVVAPLPSAADIASCSHVVSSNVNEVDAIGTGLPVEIVDCESGSIDVASAELVVGNDVEFGLIDVVSAELVVGNVVARNVSKLLVNVELVAGVVEASTAVIVDVPSIMPDQSIPAFPMASTEVMEPTKTAREASKGVADLMQQLKKNSKKSGTKGRVKNTRAELERIQLPILSGASTDQLLEQEEKSVSLELQDLLRVVESSYRKKTRVSWVREGDSNTNFFILWIFCAPPFLMKLVMLSRVKYLVRR
ncbi:hypothetical protein V6N13_065656 [Hibiscus sabdariffa]